MMFLNEFSINNICAIIFDFDGIFTNNKVFVDKDKNEFVMCDRSDGLAFDLLKKLFKKKSLKIKLLILSTETNPVVLARANKLNIECHYGVSNKLDFLKRMSHSEFPNQEKSQNGFIYLGNDLNDFKAMEYCDFSIAPSDAHKQILSISDHVLTAKGGYGCIREFAEKLIEVSGTDLLELL